MADFLRALWVVAILSLGVAIEVALREGRWNDLHGWKDGRPLGAWMMALAGGAFLGHLSGTHPTWPAWLVAILAVLGGVGFLLVIVCRRPDDARVATLKAELEEAHRHLQDAHAIALAQARALPGTTGPGEVQVEYPPTPEQDDGGASH